MNRSRLPSRTRLLAYAIACAVGAPAPAALASTWTVNSCTDADTGSGTTGSLRYAVGHADTGDTVDLTQLTCSTISLKTGSIKVQQNSLTLVGPGEDKLTISGKYNGNVEADNIIAHTGAGILSLRAMTIANGYLQMGSSGAYGGCIYSNGSVAMNHVDVLLCTAKSTKNAVGGAIFANGSVAMTYSKVFGGNALGNDNTSAGGIYASGLLAKYSEISYNSAGQVGGIYSSGDVTLKNTTVAHNQATVGNIGGIDAGSVGQASSQMLSISNSTISNNSAFLVVGGLYTNFGTVNIHNSTIAFNTANAGQTQNGIATSPGIFIAGSRTAVQVDLQSSLFSENTFGTTEDDFSAGYLTHPVAFSASTANNLIRHSTTTAPAGTLTGVCPLLGKLRNNGGYIATRALLSRSAGIDVGNNVDNRTFDGRGSSATAVDFPRVSHGQADVGAYEINQDDVIFNAAFEACTPLT